MTVSGTGVVRVGPSQYTLRLTQGASATSVGGLTDAANNAVTPVTTGLFTYGSRSSTIATIDSATGVITTHARGGVSLYVRFPQGCFNAPFDGGPASSNFIEAIVDLTVIE